MRVQVVLMMALVIAAGAQETVIHTFAGTPDGGFPAATLVAWGGNFYGTTGGAGAFGAGTVYEVTPEGEETILYSFTGGEDGGNPAYASLIFDQPGNLYGTTYGGGATGYGTVFKLDPDGNETVLYSFDGVIAGNPEGGLVFDSAGNLYGTALSSTPNCGGGCSVVFELSAAGEFSIIYAMPGYLTGGGSLAIDAVGNLYGTYQHLSKGTVYKLTAGSWQATVLHSFTGSIYSAGALVVDAGGKVWGTTMTGGAGGAGMVFALGVNPKGKWVVKVWHAFTGGADGNQPYAGIVFDPAGNIFGTTTYGGSANMGTVYELVRGPKKAITYTERVLYSFDSASGSYPFSGLVVSGGSVYGVAEQGGEMGKGVVFVVGQ